MIAKLIAVAFIAIAFVAVSDATVAVTTFSDSACTTAVGFYSSTNGCSEMPSKRDVNGVPTCRSAGVNGPWYQVFTCNTANDAPLLAEPVGFQAIKFNGFSGCDFSKGFEIYATATSAETSVVIYYVGGFQFTAFSATLSCDEMSGNMTIQFCFPGLACGNFDNVATDVCTTATTPFESQVSSGIQTTCVAPPQAPPMAPPMEVPMTPPMAAPMTATPVAPIAAPVAAPKAATPVKKSSDAVSVVVGSVAALVSAVTLIL